MGYYIFTDGNYITQVCKTSTGTGNATEADYNAVISTLRNCPEGNHRLRTDLTWAPVLTAPEPEPDPPLSGDEAIQIITERETVTREEAETYHDIIFTEV